MQYQLESPEFLSLIDFQSKSINIEKEEIIKLTTMFSGNPKILLSPHSQQSSPIVATAWGRRIELETSDDGTLEAFVDFFVDGETAPEAGITCGRGIGRPPNDPYTLNR